MSDVLISYLNKVFNIFTRLKNRQWANKEKNLIRDEVIIILVSAFLAYLIVSLLPEPKNYVPIEPITFETFLSLFPRCFTSFFNFLQALGSFFGNISAKFRRILGPVWDIIMFIPSKIIGLLQFMIICIITFLKNILEIFYNIFSIIFSPFKSLMKFFGSIGAFLGKIPGFSFIINFFKSIFNGIYNLFANFFSYFVQFGRLFKNFNFQKFLASLKNLKFFNFIGSIFNFIFRFFEWLFRVTIGRLLNIFHLSGFFVNVFLKIGSFFKYIFVHLLNIPKFFNYISLQLSKLKFRFRGMETIANIIIGFFNLLKWIALFPFFLILRFFTFLSYILRSLNFKDIAYWWNHLCQDSGECGGMNINLEKIANQTQKIDNLENEIKELKELLANITKS